MGVVVSKEASTRRIEPIEPPQLPTVRPVEVEQASKEPITEGGQPAEEPITKASQPAEEPITEGGQPAEEPITEGGQPAEEPITKGGQPAEEPITEGGQPAEEPITEGGQPADEPISQLQPDKPGTSTDPSPMPTVDQIGDLEGVDEEENHWWDWLKWCPTSKRAHRELERNMLESLILPYRFRSVNIGPVVGTEDCKIWTLCVNEACSEGLPLVLLHGFGSGLALWALNLDELGMNRPVYAFDILGFGASSRPKFSSTPEAVENEFIASIEAWRKAIGLERFVIVGHSFGGYLSTVYAIRYPHVVQGLCLGDPWGYRQCPANVNLLNLSTPLLILLRIFVPFNLPALWIIRFLGRIAPAMIQLTRQDLIQNFVPQVKDASRVVSNYIFHCNSRAPTGEVAFNCLMASFGWAQNPLSHRIHQLHQRIPLTVINGARSWVDHATPSEIDEHRGRLAFVETVNVDGCGHHVYTEDRAAFNKIVLQACMNIKSDDVGILHIRDVTEEESGVVLVEEDEVSRIEELE